ncbi:DegT/DnrJ/EryC1/StrS family aminotransferase [Rhizohabitans arisaemae]|uniref:DegT/DnrJ/EryC1/StrS family aminotransferase n=1 Tax=Rhizohabitans arisaemae TaxID=2720610 RepID=UPI0024B1597B|nr:DegT/DnrJ/EryC1/StrS family aminotransferase [Rhizohabitans arisaemae]
MIPVMKPWLGAEEAEAAAAAVASGWVAQGPRVAEFERAFAEFIGVPHAIAVSSCTTALHLCLIGAGVGPGDEVIVPSLSFIATANVVHHAGATPVCADVDAVTLNLTPESVRAVTTERTKAVIVVDQGGIPADLDAFASLGLAVVEDAACGAGSTYRGRPVGAGAALAAYSFHPRKLLTTGEGGMVTVQDEQTAVRLRRLREHAMSVSAADRHSSSQPVLEEYLEVAYNYRMTDIQAAIGLIQLRKLPEMVARRRELAARYQDAFSGLAGVTTAADPAYGTTNFQSFWVSWPDLDQEHVLKLLAGHGVSARRGIMASHLEPAYRGRSFAPLPVTERLTRHSVILPLFHQMTTAEQDTVIAAVRDAHGD